MPKEFLITKADGTLEPFKPAKLMSSLLKSKATEEEALHIVERVENELKSGVTTEEIYHSAYKWLSQGRKGPAARYALRRALSELGPTGFPFEMFIAEILKTQGFKTEVGIQMMGRCVAHEVDVVGYGNGRFVVCEAKFHNQPQIKSDVKVALYVHARFQDLEANNFAGYNKEGVIAEPWLITNTKFTESALIYGKCVGLKMIGWSYPKKGNLQELIESANLEPVTTLTTLTDSDKSNLLSGGKVLCKDINKDILKEAGIPKNKHDEILEEVAGVCPM